jgi:hypothetical protein
MFLFSYKSNDLLPSLDEMTINLNFVVEMKATKPCVVDRRDKSWVPIATRVRFRFSGLSLIKHFLCVDSGKLGKNQEDAKVPDSG